MTLLISFCTVLADQDGRNCWCNVDEYGCWVTEDDGGKTYLMFWSEPARQYIMGAGSDPYKFVVRHPGLTDTLPLECGIKQPVISTAASDNTSSDSENTNMCDEYSLCIFDECDGGTGTASCFERCRNSIPCDSYY